MRKFKVYKGKARQNLIKDILILRKEGLTLREVGVLKEISHELVRTLEGELLTDDLTSVEK